MAYYDFLNIAFAPLLKLPTVWAILIVSFIVSISITIITKYVTDQNLMKRLREESKELQKQFRESRTNPQSLNELKKKQSELMIQQFKYSFKPTIITILPLFLVFGWMSSVFAYETIKPSQEFNISVIFNKNFNGEAEINVPDGVIVINDKKANIVPGRINKVNYDKTATWILKGGEGRYIIEIIVDNNIETKDVLITNEPKYEKSEKAKKPMFSLISDKNYLSKSSNIDLIKINYKKLILIPIGIKDWLGWLGTYIWSSLIFTMVLRKMMKVY